MNESIPLGRSPMHRILIPARIAFVCLGPASASGPSVFDWRVGKLETSQVAHCPTKRRKTGDLQSHAAQQSGGKLETFGRPLGGVRIPPDNSNNPSRRLIHARAFCIREQKTENAHANAINEVPAKLRFSGAGNPCSSRRPGTTPILIPTG